LRIWENEGEFNLDLLSWEASSRLIGYVLGRGDDVVGLCNRGDRVFRCVGRCRGRCAFWAIISTTSGGRDHLGVADSSVADRAADPRCHGWRPTADDTANP
jgi:hypothetical protein